MNESYGEGVQRRRVFIERRKMISEEFKKLHPEGLTPANLKEAQAFFKRREMEIKREDHGKEAAEKR